MLVGKMMGLLVIVVLLVLIIVMLMMNIVVNVVLLVYDFLNLVLYCILFCIGGYIMVGIGLVMMLWKILEMIKGYIFMWLVGYGVLLGLVVGIMMVDYFLVCCIVFKMGELFCVDGLYGYGNGWNGCVIVVFVIGVLFNLLGFFK